MAEPLLIVGASGRAAAASALRAGFDPFVIDLFADADTTRLCPVLKCDLSDYPHGFVELAKQAPPGPWMYTGGLENHPAVVAAISEKRELWGNGPEVLRKVRDPWFLDSLPKHVAGFAEVLPRTPGPDLSPWPFLRKPLRGGGGGGVTHYESGDRFDDPDLYYQEFVDGEPESAIFAATIGGVPVPLGRTRQLVGTPWLHARLFQYAGNVARPWDEAPLFGWPADLCAAGPLRGLFGLDFVGQSVVEVNPRYTASVEVVELAHGVPLLDRATPPPPAPHVVGKAIYYAADRITFPQSGPWDGSLARCRDVWRVPDFADIPHPGTVIEPGQPVFTLFASAATEAECVHQLRSKAAECDRLFGFSAPEGDA